MFLSALEQKVTVMAKKRKMQDDSIRTYVYNVTCRPTFHSDHIPTSIKQQSSNTNKTLQFISASNEYHQAVFQLATYLKRNTIPKEPLIYEISQVSVGMIYSYNLALFKLLTYNGEIQRWGQWDMISEWQLSISQEEIISDSEPSNCEEHEVLDVKEYT